MGEYRIGTYTRQLGYPPRGLPVQRRSDECIGRSRPTHARYGLRATQDRLCLGSDWDHFCQRSPIQPEVQPVRTAVWNIALGIILQLATAVAVVGQARVNMV